MSRRPFQASLIGPREEREIYTPYSASATFGMTPKAYYRLIDQQELATTAPDVYRFSGKQLLDWRQGRKLPSIKRRSKHSGRLQSKRKIEDTSNITQPGNLSSNI